jgi:DNA-binding CsgD family transcriptional regulator
MAMSEVEQFSAFIGEIYEAAVNTSRWTDVIGKAARFVGGCSAVVFSRDVENRSGKLHHHSGRISNNSLQTYFKKYIRYDPLMVQRNAAELDEPVAITDVLPYNEFVNTRFYKEWAQPQGLVDFIVSVLDQSEANAWCFGVFRHESDGLVDDRTRQRMRLIIPHIRRTMQLNKLMDIKVSENATFTNTLDNLSAGVCLVSADGLIIHANKAGHAILDRSDYLFTSAGRLSARDLDADQAMQEMFAAAARIKSGTSIHSSSLPLKAGDGQVYVAHVMPLTVGARRTIGVGDVATAAVFVHKMDIVTPSLPNSLAKHFKLTPGEIRILLTVIEEPRIAEVAQRLGVTPNTVKTHLGRLYAKTGVGRQADLVKIVAGFSAPFLG